MTAPYLAHDIARDVFGPPRGILAWGPELPGAGKCVSAPGGYRVTGQWGFATGSRHATWLGAHCPIFEQDGSPRLGPNGRQLVRTMLVPKREATVIDNWQVLGLRGTGSDSYRFDDHFVAQAYTASRDNGRAAGAEPALPVHQRHDLRDEFRTSRSASRGRLRRLYRDRARQAARGAKGRCAEQRRPVADRHPGEAEIGAPIARRHRRDVGRGAETGRISPSTTRSCASPRPGRSTNLRDVVATVYAAGASAIFTTTCSSGGCATSRRNPAEPGPPHHFETVGQMLMGLPPEGRMFR
jgi:hypothetical protein